MLVSELRRIAGTVQVRPAIFFYAAFIITIVTLLYLRYGT